MTSCAALPFKLFEQDVLLLCQKAIYWQQQQALIVADVHLGKVGHFRKAGIAVPRDLEQNDLAVLSDLIDEHQPKKIIFLGDLFHSDMNADWEWFKLWRQQFSRISFDLVKGNHDIMPDAVYEELQINVHPALTLRNIHFIHEPCEDNNGFAYTFSGHLHPAFVMHGAGRQRLRLPCFYFGRHCGILPAFGHFTGSASLDPEERDPVFVIAGKTIIRAQ